MKPGKTPIQASPVDFQQWLAQLQRRAEACRWRYLLVLAGTQQWGRALCESSPVLAGEQTLWVGDQLQGHRTITAAQGTSLLGSETQHIVYDAWCGFHPNAFAALSGTVRAGGVLVLLAPPLGQWADYADPDYKRLAVHGAGSAKRLFLQHLVKCLEQDAHTLVVGEGDPLPVLPQHEQAAAVLPPTNSPHCLTVDQAEAVAAIVHVVTGHRDRPLVLTADRGRGKSAALGIAAATLLEQGVEGIVLTAPLRSSVECVFKHAALVLPEADIEGNQLAWQGRSLRFIPPDELLRTRPTARLLLVDEAAAIPAPLLSKMLDHYHRVVFTSTIHGYEGTGRGFAVRFLGELARRKPQWVQRTLEQPIRWSPGDPLEAIVSKLCWLDAAAAADGAIAGALTADMQVEFIDRQLLLDQPDTMAQLIGLLTTAHYRTTPDDTRILLDAPNVFIAIARHRGGVVGALLLAREGGLEPAMVSAICQGERRPRGHLLPQIHWAQCGSRELLARPGWRVVRIAVHPAVQRRGIGLLMLDQLRQAAEAQGVHYLGSSFGATTDLLAFWRRAGYEAMAVGWRRDAASGTHAVLVLQGLVDPVNTMIEVDRARFARVLPSQLADQLRLVESDVIAALLAVIGERHFALERRDRQDLNDFVVGARSYEHCAPALARAALALLAREGLNGALDLVHREALTGRILQHHSWGEVARRTALTGKAQVVQLLREVLARVAGDMSR